MYVLRILYHSGLFLTVRTFEAIVCENDKKTITCHDGFLNITSANYGRTDFNTCQRIAWNDINCKADRSLEILKNSCDGQFSCELNASNKIFDDPCHGIFKYLNVSYECYGPVEITAETTKAGSISSNTADITTNSNTVTGSSAISYNDTTTGFTGINVTTVIANQQDINNTGTIVGVVFAVFLVFIICTIAAVYIRKMHYQHQSSKRKYVHKADNVNNRNCSPIKTDPSTCNDMKSDIYELAGPSTQTKIPPNGYDSRRHDVEKIANLDTNLTSSNSLDNVKWSRTPEIPIGYDFAQLPDANGNRIGNEYELLAKAPHSSDNHIPSDYEFLKPTETDYPGADYVYTDYREGEYDNLHDQRRKINNGENNIYAHTNIGDTEETPYDVTGGQLSQYDANNYDHTTFRADDYAMAGHLSEKDDTYDHSNI